MVSNIIRWHDAPTTEVSIVSRFSPRRSTTIVDTYLGIMWNVSWTFFNSVNSLTIELHYAGAEWCSITLSFHQMKDKIQINFLTILYYILHQTQKKIVASNTRVNVTFVVGMFYGSEGQILSYFHYMKLTNHMFFLSILEKSINFNTTITRTIGYICC